MSNCFKLKAGLITCPEFQNFSLAPFKPGVLDGYCLQHLKQTKKPCCHSMRSYMYMYFGGNSESGQNPMQYS